MIRAIHFPDIDKFKSYKTPGSFSLTQPDAVFRTQFFWYYCPCGCGHLAALLVGNGFKPGEV